jgi:hypothetical protein
VRFFGCGGAGVVGGGEVFAGGDAIASGKRVRVWVPRMMRVIAVGCFTGGILSLVVS